MGSSHEQQLVSEPQQITSSGILYVLITQKLIADGKLVAFYLKIIILQSCDTKTFQRLQRVTILKISITPSAKLFYLMICQVISMIILLCFFLSLSFNSKDLYINLALSRVFRHISNQIRFNQKYSTTHCILISFLYV